MMSKRPTERCSFAPSYRHVAWCYDALASGYSLGAIDRAKRVHHGLVQAGDRVLYAGAGRGADIVEVCRRGAEVTCVEPCPAMAARLHKRLSQCADGFTIVPKPIQDIAVAPMYDLVVAHFFLNVFDSKIMPAVLAHLCGFVKPGGRIVIADFKPGAKNSGPIDRLVRSLYYHPVHLPGVLMGICALHPIYDYTPLLAEQGLTVESQHDERVIPGLPAWYSVTIGRRPSTHRAGPPAS